MSELKPQTAPTMRIEILPKSDREAAPEPQKKIPKVRARADTPVAGGEANFQELFQRVYDGAIIAEFDGAIVDANQRILEFLETDRAGLERQGILGVISGSDAALLDTLRRNLEDNRFTLIQAHCLRHDGSAFPAEIAVSRLTLSGRPYLCFFVRDVTVRRKAEETLRQERNLLHTLIDNLPDLIYVKDTQSRFIIGNRAVARLMGVETPEGLLDKTDEDFFPRELADQYRADEVKVVETGVPLVEKEEPCVNARGKRLLLLTTKVPLRDSTGRVVGVVGIGRDITEQRVMEHQRVHAQKMESIGQLAAGIAHEINTPIQYIGDNLRFLSESFAGVTALLKKVLEAWDALPDGAAGPEAGPAVQEARKTADVDYLAAEIPAALEQSLEGVSRVSKIVAAMKEFSHPDDEAKAPANLNKAIESTITVSRNEWKYAADIVTELDPALPLVPCLLGSFNQVILNLIVNAAHAIAGKTAAGASGKGVIRIVTRQDGDWAVIRVTDTGTGIPQAIRSRIFEPFFTTKEVGKGTGQGLSTCHSIVVKKHGGAIAFETEEGKGTTFIVRLPLKPAGA